MVSDRVAIRRPSPGVATTTGDGAEGWKRATKRRTNPNAGMGEWTGEEEAAGLGQGTSPISPPHPLPTSSSCIALAPDATI